jgi:hypothetical protein
MARLQDVVNDSLANLKGVSECREALDQAFRKKVQMLTQEEFRKMGLQAMGNAGSGTHKGNAGGGTHNASGNSNTHKAGGNKSGNNNTINNTTSTAFTQTQHETLAKSIRQRCAPLAKELKVEFDVIDAKIAEKEPIWHRALADSMVAIQFYNIARQLERVVQTSGGQLLLNEVGLHLLARQLIHEKKITSKCNFQMDIDKKSIVLHHQQNCNILEQIENASKAKALIDESNIKLIMNDIEECQLTIRLSFQREYNYVSVTM